jgi:hypothetical protein
MYHDHSLFVIYLLALRVILKGYRRQLPNLERPLPPRAEAVSFFSNPRPLTKTCAHWRLRGSHAGSLARKLCRFLLFLMELFDQDALSPVANCICYDIEDGVAAFEDVISR